MLSILYVDDEPALLELGKLFLEQGGQFSVTIISSAPAALELLKAGNFDAVIADYQMPGMNGIEFLKRVRGSGNSIPFILFTGRGREEVVIQALNEGADYYIQKGGDPKPQFWELSHKTRQAIQQRRAEVSIRDHERIERDIISFLPDATFAIDRNGIVIMWNRAIEEMTGVPASKILGKGTYEYALPFYRERRPMLIDLVLEEDPATLTRYPFVARNGRTLRSENRFPHMNNGTGAWLWFTASPLFNDRNEVVGAIESIRDVTDRKRAQEEIQAQNEELQASFEQITATEEELRQNLDTLVTSHEALLASEEKYRRIVDTANEGIWAMDQDLRTTFVNEQMAAILGYSREEMLGKTVDSFMLADELTDHQKKITTRKQGKPGKYERRFRCRDGRVIWAQVSATPILTNTGEFAGSFAMFTDITPAKQAEEALKKKNEELFASYEQLAAAEEELRQNYDELAKAQGRVQESEERYRAVIEDQTEFICRFTPDGRLTFVNDAYCRYFGIDKNECLNRLHTVKLFQEDARLMKHHLSSLSPANPVARIEHRITLPSGEVRWQQWNDRAIYAPDGQVTEYQSVGRDITDRRQTEEALRQANHRLTVMTGITRHDIGNQILVILSYLEMARTEHADPAMDEYIGKLESAARSIRAQIEFSKVYQDIGSQKPRWLDGEFLLHRLTVPAPVKVTAGLGGVEVYADPMLEKLFANLLDNSIRHGETVTEIRVSSRLSDEGLTLLWEDNGVGIAADDKERIFERGFGKNTGLGLFLCREILSLTGMGITETGEPKKGARFEITVPKGSFRYTSRK